MAARKKISEAPSGENTSLAGTEKVPVSGSQYTLISTIATYLRTLAQTLTNKTINLASNTLTGTTAEFNTALSDGNFATLAGTEVLTGKTVNLSSNTLTGTTAQFNTALSDNDFTTLAGSETLTNKTLTSPTINSPTIATPTVTGAITLPDDVRQTFNPGANNAGLNVGSVASDPASPSNGDIWYDSGNNTLDARINGATVNLGAGGGSVATDTIWDAKGDLAVGTGANTAAKLTAGADGLVLTTDSGEATGLKWSSVAGTGDVVGPASATDNAIARFDSTTGKLIQDTSAVTISDAGAFSFPDNVRQTFNPGADAAGLNVGSIAGDPGTPSNGDLWYDSTANELTARINGANVALGAGGAGGGYDEGTSFPGSPTTNDKYYRTDRNLLYYYDGTRWLTTTLYIATPTIGDGGAVTYSTNNTHGYFCPDPTYGMYLVALEGTTGIFGTNDGSNYWTVNFFRRSATNTNNDIANYTTAADTASNWVRHSTAINAVLDSSARILGFQHTKTGGPGNLYVTSRLTYRLIG